MNALERAQALLAEVEQAELLTAEQAEAFRLRFLGSKNQLKELMALLKTLPTEERKQLGHLVNVVKQLAEEKYRAAQQRFSPKVQASLPADITRPGWPYMPGSRHPVAIVRDQIIDIFLRLGFALADGPEIEDDWHNFTALNMPEDHPARDMTDTFYLSRNPDLMLRSQTSNVQIRIMERQQPPIRIIAAGRVYRNETITYKAHVFFHQIEGLYVDEAVSFANLKQTILYFVDEFFGADYECRIRPSYFPFTEISAEVDIRRKGTERWLEIMGCGMVHPEVLRNCKIDPDRYSGFAFGMGIERPAMLKYGITDIRILYENDLRFLRQFISA
ncbi:MAG: phenylalanine--tRNA ligase subunit alpha [Chitinophagales bacterium]|nr:phenylalanine--tRNA ligase subunit alpha [Chitinophagales bacterium]MDW8428135.1 phenylalanine--tRNA ligase subunit alpha [Chitinophagales bacterium]